MKIEIIMEQRKISFDELWEQEERQGLTSRLQVGYPAWLRRRNRRRTVAIAVAVLGIAGFSILYSQSSIPDGYDYVCCNRGGVADAHWAEVASHILTIETL